MKLEKRTANTVAFEDWDNVIEQEQSWMYLSERCRYQWR